MIKLKYKINFNPVIAHLHVETYEIHNKNNVINYFGLKIQLQLNLLSNLDMKFSWHSKLHITINFN